MVCRLATQPAGVPFGPIGKMLRRRRQGFTTALILQVTPVAAEDMGVRSGLLGSGGTSLFTAMERPTAGGSFCSRGCLITTEWSKWLAKRGRNDALTGRGPFNDSAISGNRLIRGREPRASGAGNGSSSQQHRGLPKGFVERPAIVPGSLHRPPVAEDYFHAAQ